MKVVIITGMSGAGRSRAANWFEDQGYYCVDNMPPELMDRFLGLAGAEGSSIDQVAFVADLRSGSFFGSLSDVIDELRSRKDVELTVLFMEASPEEIVRRYNEVRRSHPLTGGEASTGVIEIEKEMLTDIRKKSDFILDTTGLKIAEMNEELDKVILGGRGESGFTYNIRSFGFKYGIPAETDIMFDVRFIPNPYYVPSLRRLTGNNKKVTDYIFRNDTAVEFVESVYQLIRSVTRGYIKEGKYHLNIAFGCTGGHHRSVAVANALAERFRDDGMRVHLSHRDLELQNRKSK